MTRTPSEYELQRALCIWLDGNPDANGVPRVRPALLPGVVYWHTPNGGSRSSAFEGKRLREAGLKPGIHDKLFLRAGRLYGLELKVGNNKLSAEQIEMHRRLLAAGLAGSATVWTLADARAQLVTWQLAQFS